ncbi:MAG: sulfurtransferase TusA family protein [Elusimicrobiota bacterium]
MDYDNKLDCVGLYCPLPIVKTKLEMENMSQGEVLRVTADDLGAKEDFPAWCSETGNELVGTEEIEGEFVFYIKKK